MNTQFDEWFKDDPNGLHCEHEFKKYLAKSGMHYISYCNKCETSKPYANENAEDEAYEKKRAFE